MPAILILAGGGGHTSIAIALAQQLYRKTEVSFLIPRSDWLSEKLLGGYGETHHLTKARGPLTPNYLFMFRFPLALFESILRVSKRFDLVVSCGSNFCIPPAFIAWLKGIPIVNIESRVALKRPSKTAKLLKSISLLTVLQWEEQRINLDGVVTGPIFPKTEFEPWKGGYILVTGGTEGYKRLFDAFSESGIENIVLQTGKIDPEPYRQRHPYWKVFSLTENFQQILAGADIVVTHQGGGTIFEAIMLKKPLIIVHNPELRRTANEEDMRILVKKTNATYITDIDTKKIVEAVRKIQEQPSPRIVNGTNNVINLILKILYGFNRSQNI
jgi:UDP-N-acetylglucosamine--N-acetylmuramyl-(pentapeptide) pyrophosphoryl-undecaprenol N-acetylglucosamine transferase